MDWTEFTTQFGLLRTRQCNFRLDIADFHTFVVEVFAFLGCYAAHLKELVGHVSGQLIHTQKTA